MKKERNIEREISKYYTVGYERALRGTRGKRSILLLETRMAFDGAGCESDRLDLY